MIVQCQLSTGDSSLARGELTLTCNSAPARLCFFLCILQCPRVLAWFCVDALKGTVGKLARKTLSHFSRLSRGTKSKQIDFVIF